MSSDRVHRAGEIATVRTSRSRPRSPDTTISPMGRFVKSQGTPANDTFPARPGASEMSPMQRDETWEQAIQRSLEENKQRECGPTTLGELQRALSENAETGRKTLTRVRKKNRATPRRRDQLSAALQVPIETLPPPAKKPTVDDLEDLLEELAARVATLERAEKTRRQLTTKVLQRLDALEATIETPTQATHPTKDLRGRS